MKVCNGQGMIFKVLFSDMRASEYICHILCGAISFWRSDIVAAEKHSR